MYELAKSASGAVHPMLQVEDDVARRKDLAHAVGGADGGAAAALGAGVEVEQVFPGEIGQALTPSFSSFSKSSLLERGPDRLQPRRVDIERRVQHVGHLAERRPGDECEHQRQVRPPADAVRDEQARPGSSAACEALATRLPTGDQAPQGSSVAAIRQPSIRKPVTSMARIASRMTFDSVVVDQVLRPQDDPPRKPAISTPTIASSAEDIDEQRLEVQIEPAPA